MVNVEKSCFFMAVVFGQNSQVLFLSILLDITTVANYAFTLYLGLAELIPCGNPML